MSETVLMAVLGVMMAKAEDLYRNGGVKIYNGTERRGSIGVSIRLENGDDWMTITRPFGVDGRGGIFGGLAGSDKMDQGVSNVGIVMAKIARGKRLGGTSDAADEADVRLGEIHYRGWVTCENPEIEAIFAFSGFDQDDDTAVAEVGLATYKEMKGIVA
jgi:hypothetical protein